MMNPGEVLIHAGNYQQFINPVVNGEVKKCGTTPRPWQQVPLGSMQGVPVSSIPKIPRSEWSARLKDQIAAKARLSDVRNRGMYGQRIPSRDQNGKGYCWAHSSTSAALLSRARDNQPYADLSAFAIACMIKGYRDEGGWNGESMKFIQDKGVPTSATWPQQSMSRANDNSKTWEEAAKYKETDWEDIPEGDFDQQATYSLLAIPYALDLNWWSHSIGGSDLVDGTASFNAGLLRAVSGKLQTLQEFELEWEVHIYGDAYGARIWNSWGDSWSDGGMGTLTEGKARNNGAMALVAMRQAA